MQISLHAVQLVKPHLENIVALEYVICLKIFMLILLNLKGIRLVTQNSQNCSFLSTLHCIILEKRCCAGYSKKKISELRGVSITPTILSVSLDQTQALHAEDPPELAQLKVMSIGDDKGSKSSLVEHVSLNRASANFLMHLHA